MVFYSSNITMKHGPINIKYNPSAAGRPSVYFSVRQESPFILVRLVQNTSAHRIGTYRTHQHTVSARTEHISTLYRHVQNTSAHRIGTHRTHQHTVSARTEHISTLYRHNTFFLLSQHVATRTGFSSKSRLVIW